MTADQRPVGVDASEGRPLRLGLGAMFATCGAVFMAGLDNLVVTIALPEIRRDLDIGIKDLTWTVNAYTLTYAVFMLGAAVLGDRLGRRRVFLVGLSLFIVGSAGVGLLGTSLLLMGAFRVVQGLGAAALMPLSLTLALDHAPVNKRAATVAGWSAMYGLSTAIGPFVGGAIVEFASWQWIFLVNLPIGGLILIAARSRLEDTAPPPRTTDLDVRSLVLLCLGLFGLVLGVMRSGEVGWLQPSSSPLMLAGAALLVAFVGRQRTSADPLVPLDLITARSFALTSATAFFVSAGMYGIIFLLTQYLQVVLRYEPLAAGVSTLPWTILPVIVAPCSVVAARRFGIRRLMIAGVTLMAAALAWFAIVLDPDVNYAMLLPGMILGGLGMGLFFALVAAQALSFAPDQHSGLASGVNNSIRQIGIVTGITLITTLFAALGGTPTPAGFDLGITGAVVLAVALLLIAVVTAIRTPESST